MNHPVRLYTVPQKELCDVLDHEVDIDPDDPDRLVLHINHWFYAGRLVRFSLSLVTDHPLLRREVIRIDTCHSKVHRHTFCKRLGEARDRHVYQRLSEGDVSAVERWAARAYDILVDTAEEQLRRWAQC